jgi:hypothetical protein
MIRNITADTKQRKQQILEGIRYILEGWFCNDVLKIQIVYGLMFISWIVG